MLGKIRFHRRSIVLTWLLSYLAILLLPVVISIIVYTESSRTLESEIHEANRSLLNQVREVMDNQFKLMERLTLEMRTNVKVGDLLYSKRYQDVPNEYIYNRYLITQDLKQVKTSYPLIDLFYIYIAETNTILLPGLVREGPFGYQLIHRDNGFSYDKWHSVVNLPDFKGFIPMVRMNEDEIRRKSAAYVTTFPSDDGKAVATSVVMIDEARLLGAIQNVELFNQGHVFVLNSNNEVIISNSNGKLQLDIPLGEMMESSGLFYYVQDDQKFEAMYIKSSVSGLKYVSLIPSRLYWEKAEHVRRLTYMSMLFSVIGGGLLAYVFLRKNYNPVRQLVQVFSDKAEVPFGSGHNEFQFIRQALDSTLSQMDKILDQMKQQRHVLRSNFISRLMKGRLDNQIPIDDTLVTFNMRFYSNDFAVILFHVEKSAPFHERTSSMDPNDRLKLLQFIVTNVVEELAKERNGGFVAEVDEALACLISFKQTNAEERKEHLLHIAREAQRFLASAYHIQLTVSISSIHSGLTGISQAYTEALDAMEYKLVMGSKEILSYEQIRSESSAGSEAGYYYPLQVEQQLINYVKIGDFDQAKLTLDDIIDRNFNRPNVSVPIARCLMLNLASTMIKTMGEIGDVQESFLVRNPQRIELLLACDTIQDMQQQMTELLGKVCEYTGAKRQQNIQQSRQRALNALTDDVNAFIEERYADSSLNIAMIGSRFELKPTYLSKLYKDQTGEGLLDAIQKVRVRQAKRLVETSKKTMIDIAGDVGFNDVNVFIRAFKKYEGITPGKYKEMIET